MEDRRWLTRRHDRVDVMLPVVLLSASGGGMTEQRGTVTNLSKAGVRIQTGPSLNQGQFLKMFLRGVAKPYAACRVVWSRTQGSALPSEAGLEILSPDPTDGDFLSELRGVYHNPASSQ